MYYSAGYQGAQDAQFRLGLFFYEGRNGFAKDYMEAFRYFQKAADTSMSMPTHKWLGGAIPQKEMYTRDKAQYYLGKMYHLGQGIAQNFKLALEWYTKSANQENPLAQYDISMLYIKGSWYIPKNTSLGVMWCQKAAYNNHSEAQYNLGHLNYHGIGVPKNQNQAIYWFRKAVNNDGNRKAQSALEHLENTDQFLKDDSRISSEGQRQLNFIHQETSNTQLFQPKSQQKQYSRTDFNGQPSIQPTSSDSTDESDNDSDDDSDDILSGSEDATKIIKTSDPTVQNLFGELLRDSSNLTQSYESTYLGLIRSEQTNHDSRTQYNIAECHLKGQGTRQSYYYALEWYTKAADQGEAAAQYMMGEFCSLGHGVIRTDNRKALSWYTKAAENNYSLAQYKIGHMNFRGSEYVAYDRDLAFKWYMRSAKQGHANAQCQVGKCFYHGLGVTESFKQAMFWFQKSVATEEDGGALFNIGSMYHNGQGIGKDYDLALRYYKKAAEMGYEKFALPSIKKLESTMKQAKVTNQQSKLQSQPQTFPGFMTRNSFESTLNDLQVGPQKIIPLKNPDYAAPNNAKNFEPAKFFHVDDTMTTSPNQKPLSTRSFFDRNTSFNFSEMKKKPRKFLSRPRYEYQ